MKIIINVIKKNYKDSYNFNRELIKMILSEQVW